MSTEIQAGSDLRVKYMRGHEDREEREVQMLEDGEQHTDFRSRQTEPNSEKKLPAVRRSCFRVFTVSLVLLYLLILAAIIIRYFLVTLEKENLETRYNDLNKTYTELKEKKSINNTQLENRYNFLRKNYSQLQNKVKKMEKKTEGLTGNYSELDISYNLLQDEVKMLNNIIEEGKLCPKGWKRFGSSFYFKSTEKKIWSESRTDCQSRGSDLVMINSKEEQEFVTKNMNGESWIGLWREKTGQQWKWVDGSPLKETFWATRDPDPHWWFYATCCDQGKWTKTHYNSYKTWICEKQISSSSG